MKPDLENIAYGPHERNVLDLYRAPSDAPTPVLFFIHGGGFRGGDKASMPRPLLDHLLERGISVVSTNYRFSQHAIYPAPFHDCRRAFQFVRRHALSWGMDPTRIGAAGASAGAGMSLWLAFRPDMADPTSDDPVARESTRPSCVCIINGQTSYDPRFISRLIGGRAHLHSALPALFGVPGETWPALDDEAIRRVEDGAAINFLSADAPPAFCLYSFARRPVTDEDDPNFGIHHPRFGEDLKERMEALGQECIVVQDERLGQDADVLNAVNRRLVDFFARHLKVTPIANRGPSPTQATSL